ASGSRSTRPAGAAQGLVPGKGIALEGDMPGADVDGAASPRAAVAAVGRAGTAIATLGSVPGERGAGDRQVTADEEDSAATAIAAVLARGAIGADGLVVVHRDAGESQTIITAENAAAVTRMESRGAGLAVGDREALDGHIRAGARDVQDAE